MTFGATSSRWQEAAPVARRLLDCAAMAQATDEPVEVRGNRAGPVSPRLGRFWHVLLAIATVALVVRFGYVAFVKDGPCPLRIGGQVVGSLPSDCPDGDELFYNAAANRLARGDGYVEPFDPNNLPAPGTGPAADHPPLTITVLAPVSFVFDHIPPFSWDADNTHMREHRYTMALLGVGVVLLVGLLGRAVAGDRVGWVAAGIAAVYPNLWVNDGLVMSETVTGLAVLGALLLAVELVKHPVPRWAAWLGVLCGLAALARAELVLFVPLLAVPAALTAPGLDRRARWRLAAAAVVAAGVVVGPWVVYNNVRFDERTLLSTNDGIALAGSNCDRVYYGGGIGLTSLDPPCIDHPHPPGDQSVVAKVYRKRAFDYMGDHASRVPVVVAARIGRTWSLFRPLDMLSYNEGEGRERWITGLGLWTYYPLLAAAVAGAVVLARRSRRDLWILLVPVAAVTIGVAVSYGQTRFRAAAEPSLAILAAVALVAWFAERRDRAAGAPQHPS